MFINRFSTRGSSIISALVAMGLIGVAVVIAIRGVSVLRQSSEKADLIADSLVVRNYVRENVDCSRILSYLESNPSACSSGNYFDVYDRKGRVVIDSKQKLLVGQYKMRASCLPATKQVLFEAMRMSAGDLTKEDTSPVIDKAQGWQDPFRGIPPISASSRKSGILDFETIPGVKGGLKIDDKINDYLDATYGVRFNYLGGATMNIAQIAYAKEGKPGYHAWMSVKCPKKPNRNQLCGGPALQAEAKRYALTTSNAMSSKSITFEILYSEPAVNPKFDIYDFDAKERWTVKGYDASGNEVASKVFQANKGYSTKGTGNSDVLAIDFNTGGKAINRLHFAGQKGIKIFGFAFDNFHTGVSTCRIGGSE